MSARRRWAQRTKRALDVTIAGGVLVATAPITAAAAIAIVSTMGRPVLFRQERVGRGERVFRIAKFRTMRPAPEGTSPTATTRGSRAWGGRCGRAASTSCRS